MKYALVTFGLDHKFMPCCDKVSCASLIDFFSTPHNPNHPHNPNKSTQIQAKETRFGITFRKAPISRLYTTLCLPVFHFIDTFDRILLISVRKLKSACIYSYTLLKVEMRKKSIGRTPLLASSYRPSLVSLSAIKKGPRAVTPTCVHH